MKKLFLLCCLSALLCACGNSQTSSVPAPRLVGGPCEGCEAIFEFGNTPLHSIDTLPGFEEAGQKIKVSGRVYQQDGKTPAAGVILYVYQTNEAGIYENKYKQTNWESRHGYIRAWLKTGPDGRYAFYTLKPGSYPQRTTPAHIHLTVLEPDGKYYWLESYHFKGDPLLSPAEIAPDAPRGGSTGLLDLQQQDGLWVGSRDIILGKHIPAYR
ncbi:MAG: intradiol ring-cleavage dioxygenase [Bacteroidetes bacterium]|nr:MAG: intradiol ring-cleavage dioxygenase [Bacteroidota bacterium]